MIKRCLFFIILAISGCCFSQNHPNSVVIDRVQTDWDGIYPIKAAILGDNYNINRIFTSIVEQIASVSESLDLAISIGDQAAGGDSAGYARYLAIIDSLPFPWITLMGNHEINDKDGWNRFIDIFGPPDFYFDIGKYRFICLTNCYPAPVPVSAGENVYYKFTSSQLDWLENLLDEWDGYKIVAAHTPPYLEMYITLGVLGSYGYCPNKGESNTERFTDLLRDYDVSLCLLGHIHFFARFKPNNEQYGNVTYIITAGAGARLVPWLCPTPYIGSFHHFILFDLYESGNIQGNVIRPDTIDDSVVTVEYDSIYSFFIEYNSIKQTKKITNSQNSMIIYPNPFNDATQIKVSEPSEILIYDLEGHLIHTVHVSEGNYTFCAVDISAGIYFVKIRNEVKPLLHIP